MYILLDGTCFTQHTNRCVHAHFKFSVDTHHIFLHRKFQVYRVKTSMRHRQLIITNRWKFLVHIYQGCFFSQWYFRPSEWRLHAHGLSGPYDHFTSVWANTWWRHQMETFSALLAIVRGIHRSPVNSPHKGQWRGALMFSLICVWINAWVNNREAGDLRRYRAHYDVIVMMIPQPVPVLLYSGFV